MNQIEAKIIADSSFRNTRLITLEIQLHRFVLSEFNTHRMISRNFQSSRAVPVKQMIEQIRADYASPVHWGKNQPGMQAKEELENPELCTVKAYWRNAAEWAAKIAEGMLEQGAHKQIVNRILEPFMWTKGVVTATERDWNNFFKLRLHKDAQPEIYALAEKIKQAINNSKTVDLKKGNWHLPYVNSFGGEDYSSQTFFVNDEKGFSHQLLLQEAIKISASCTAQVSYRKLDDSLEKAIKVYDMLNLPVDGVYPEDPPHFSPTEHIAKACDTAPVMSGNFQCNDFTQYRKVLEFGIEKEVIGG